MAEVWSGSILGLTALLAGVGLVLCGAAVLHWGHQREHGLVPYVFYPATLAVVLSVLLSGRNLDLPIDYQGTTHVVDAWATRVTSLFLLLAALERIGKRLLSYGPKHEAPTLLILALLLFFLTNVITSGLFGTRPWLSHHHVYTVLAGYAALLFTREEGDTAIRCVRNALFIFLILGALCTAWQPELVLSRNYTGLIPGLTIRYAGLAPHPNSMGPMAIVFLLCLWTMPYSARRLNLLGWTLGLASLVLTQSKTSWVAFLFGACWVTYFRHGEFLAHRLFELKRPLLPATYLLLAMLTVSLIGIAFMFGGVVERLVGFFQTSAGANLATMMGRDRIWEVAVQEWRNNPLFGYGLMMWNEEYRIRVGMDGYAYNAHNQFFQSLAVAGIVGVAGLIIYTVTLLAFVLKTIKTSQGLTLALFVLLSFQSITEVPLSMTSGYGPAQQVHLLLLMVIASRIARSEIPWAKVYARPSLAPS